MTRAVGIAWAKGSDHAAEPALSAGRTTLQVAGVHEQGPDGDGTLQPRHQGGPVIDHRLVALLHRQDGPVELGDFLIEGAATLRAPGVGVRDRATFRARISGHARPPSAEISYPKDADCPA